MSPTIFVSLAVLLSGSQLASATRMAVSTPNIYLASCITHSCYQCPVRYISAAVLYPNQLPNDDYDVDKIPVWFQESNDWAGQSRTVSFGQAGAFDYKISLAADKVEVGEVTGSGDLDGKPFTCVKQAGQTLWFPEEKDNVNCMPDHWCRPVEA